MDEGEPAPRGRWRPPPLTLLVVAAVVLLTLSALWSPPRDAGSEVALLLIVDPLASVRGHQVYAPLAVWLSQELGRPLRPLVVRSPADVPPRTWANVGLVLCPDRVALGLPSAEFTALATGRRQPPLNLRPRSMLVYRRTAGTSASPWSTAPARTILGDTLSLAGCGAACRAGVRPWRRGTDGAAVPAVGADPYDHGSVLQALLLGCFDYAVVREWDARSWSEAGLLDAAAWGVVPLGPPLPDTVVLAARRWPAADRVRVGELLVSLGRRQEAGANAAEVAALTTVARLELSGFNPLLEPDFELIRRQFSGVWLPDGP